ncbi:MAG: redoxin domain-containing protein [Armatimonadetes bacterium]|nr:redoxin domain-containing protein [Armatimonadota bacterium]
MLMTAILAASLVLTPAELPKSVTTTDGSSFALSGRKATAIIFLNVSCPIANQYQPTFNRMVKEFADKDVKFLGVYIDPTISKWRVDEHKSDYGMKYDTYVDKNHQLVKGLKPLVTPTAVVLDSQGKVTYFGRVDDTYPRTGIRRDKPTREDLRIALTEITSSKKVSVPKTEAVGCIIPDIDRG